MAKTRAYIFTINNPTCYDLGDCLELYDLYGRYMILGFEVGKKGTDHIQAYIYFDNAQHFKTVTGVLKRARVKPARGSPQQNFEYCSKDLYQEFGQIPVNGRASWDRIVEAMEYPKEHPQLYMQYRKAYQDIIVSEVPDKKKRTLCRCPLQDKYELMQELQDLQHTLCTDIDNYDGESALLIREEESVFNYLKLDHRVDEWVHGFPPKVKYGYQHRWFDPDIIVYLYTPGERLSDAIKAMPNYCDIKSQKDIEYV